ncbi:epoxide hydrolase family protein [Microbacterium sp. 2P01SA-2]|uniref:epoxide hydrolase family protein n=1 Tax=unclassified Microbacterium TaxID=2609290 RepID=UPI0039A24039
MTTLADPFMDIPQADLERLRQRLHDAELPHQSPGEDWSRGIPSLVLDRLRKRWSSGYDWRPYEQALNREEHSFHPSEIGPIHYVHRRGDAEALPVLAIHGWPYSYAQLLPMADALNGAHAVIAPSLPGFGHSPASTQPYSARRIAEAFHHLMVDGLGHKRYIVYGEDMGAPVADWIAGLYPGSVAGIVASHPSFSAQARPGTVLTTAEREFLLQTRNSAESGYAHQQGTRPDTLAAALLDSPLGLLAWIAEKIAAWSHGGHATEFSNLSDDDVLNVVSLYWHTRSIGTSFRSYAEPDDFDDHPIISVPASILVNTHESGYPESLAEKSYTDIRCFERLERSGHFTAWEDPAAIAAAIRHHAGLLAR